MTAPQRVEVPFPPPGLRFMGEDDATLLRIGRQLADRLVESGLTETSSVIDVGCGYGRLAVGIVDALPFRGRYLGFDILARHVAWCAKHMTPAAPNIQFRHLDVRNARYNPKGRIDPADTRFPAASAQFDLAAVFSVFTHLDEPAARRYLAELRRVLRGGGRAVTTWFVFDEARLEAVTSDQSRFPMRHVLGPGVRCMQPEDPLHAIAYDEALVRRWVDEAGLAVESTERGAWAGEPSRTLQDVFVLRRGPEGASLGDRAVDARLRLRELVAGVRRRAGRLVRRVRRRLGAAA